MGAPREDRTPKLAREQRDRHTPALALGLGQLFDYQDHRLDEVALMEWLGVTDLRTGLSFADSFRPDALDR